MSNENNTNRRSTFCILPYIHAQTKPSGQIKPCCRFSFRDPAYKIGTKYKFDRFNTNKGMSYTEAINSPEWEEIRTAMENNKKVPGCWKCYEEEDYSKLNGESVYSMRVKENWLWNRNNQNELSDEGKSVKGQIRYLELTLGTYCNLKCRTCTSDLSTTWVEDENILSSYYSDRKMSKPVVTIEENWDIRDFQYVEEIKFTGGEPMLHPNFIKLMDIIIGTGRAKEISLDIFTNASWVPRAKVLDRLKEFKQVKINISVDGIGKVNDYVRSPSQWDIVEKSVIEWITAQCNYPTIYTIKWAPCISIYNVWQFPEMVDWWFNLQEKVKKTTVINSITYVNEGEVLTKYQMSMMLNLVFEPKYLSVSLYPDKANLNSKLRNHRDIVLAKILKESNSMEDFKNLEGHFRGFYNKLMGALAKPVDKKLLKTFVEFTADLDKLREQDIRKDIPELWEVLKDLVEYKGRML